MRDLELENWVRDKMCKAHFPGVHDFGWSWIGGCLGCHVLEKEHPEIKEKNIMGFTLPGSMGHIFMQEYALPEGLDTPEYLILGHEQKRFIPMVHEAFRMSSVDTFLLDKKLKGIGVFDYKFVKDLNWVEQDAKDENREQINLYAYTSGALWYAVIYVSKLNYEDIRIHKYPTDPELATKSINKMKLVDRWLANDRKGIKWTDLALGLDHFSGGKNSSRYICDASSKGTYGGCLVQKYCLIELSKQFGQEFTSLVRYDEFLKQQKKGK